MELSDLDTPSALEVLDILSAAASKRTLSPGERVLVSVADRSTAEGLALLGSYTSIADPMTRQALLDLALMLGRSRN